MLTKKKKKKQTQNLSPFFKTGGIFLAAGFTHMLSESVEGFEKLELEESLKRYPLPYLLCLLGVLLTLFMEKVAFRGHQHHFGHSHETSQQTDSGDPRIEEEAQLSRGIVKPHEHQDKMEEPNMMMLALTLSAHSVIEGVALGVEDTIADTTNILIAIVSHKMFAAFAFGVSLAKSKFPTEKILKMVALFSFMTPAGIILGMLFQGSLQGSPNSPVAESIKALSSGTFIYIALVEVILEEFQTNKDAYLKFFLLVIGSIVMTGLSSHGGVHHH
jgi:zinc transporter 1/2/3